jgi:toxin ParE1/3/4
VSYGFLPEAEIEYLQAVKFYEDRRPGLGARLIKEFERTIRFAVERPLTWKMVHASGIRRIDLARFPYAIFFRLIAAGGLQVTAFAHHRRRPGYWLSRTAP